jgi:hypothetical protein
MKKEEFKKLYIEDLNFLNQMTVVERVLYRKWYEIHNKQWSKEKLNNVWMIKQLLWKWNGDPYEYLKIEPSIIHCNNKESKNFWDTMRVFCSTHIWNGIPGKIQKFYVIDKKTKKIIGFFALSSDLKDIGGRNDYIGWTKENRYKDNMLNYTAIGSTIIPTQPFGFNYIGGKLLALLICSDFVIDTWEHVYNKKLVGITTSSLYGSKSQYNSLPYWKKCKTSKGENFLEPSPHIWKLCQKFVKEKFPNSKYLSFKSYVLPIINKEFQLKKIMNNEPRGVYFNCLYDNTKEFLCKQVNKVDKKRYDNNIESLIKIWKRKCKNRVKSLEKRNGFTTDTLLYEDLITLSWEECKKKYLKKIKC